MDREATEAEVEIDMRASTYVFVFRCSGLVNVLFGLCMFPLAREVKNRRAQKLSDEDR